MKRRMIAFILAFTMVWSSLGDLSFRGNYAQAEEEVPAGTSENQETLEMAVSEAEDPEADNPSVEEQTGGLSETGQETPVEAVPAAPSEPVSETPAGSAATRCSAGAMSGTLPAAEPRPVCSSTSCLTMM